MRVFASWKELACRRSTSESTERRKLAAGLLTDPVQISPRRKGFPLAEIDAIDRACIAGWTEDQIRELVTKLKAARSGSAAQDNGGLQE